MMKNGIVTETDYRETLITRYVELATQKKQIERELKELTAKAKEFYPEVLITSQHYKFTLKSEKSILKLPYQLVQLNQGAIVELYKSALGGKKLIRKFGLEVENTTSKRWPLTRKLEKKMVNEDDNENR